MPEPELYAITTDGSAHTELITGDQLDVLQAAAATFDEEYDVKEVQDLRDLGEKDLVEWFYQDTLDN